MDSKKSAAKILMITITAATLLAACDRKGSSSVTDDEVLQALYTPTTTASTEAPPVTTTAPATTTAPEVTTTAPTTTAPTTTAAPATTKKPTTTTAPKLSQKAIKEQQARVVAQQIADSIGPGTDLERVNKASEAVSKYCAKAKYTTSGTDYCEAYGVFISGEYSCAGATRALGMVLSCMGYKWEHINANQWTHQWCKLTMDGQIGWADGQIGYVGYGEYPFV